jgi:polyphosphate kinase 2 (PPK2 family)
MSKKNKHKTADLNTKFNELKSLNKKELLQRAKEFSDQYCVGNGNGFKLSDRPTLVLEEQEKSVVKSTLKMGVKALAAMQDILYAQDKWSVLLIFQAMDAAGKDGAIKHVMSGIIHRVVRFRLLKRQVQKNWIMIFYGDAKNICRKEAVSEFLTVRIMKRFWLSAYMNRY